VAASLAVSLAGCGGKDDTGGLPSDGGQSSTTTSSTPVSTASATPTVAPTTSTQKYGALTLVLDHTAQPPADAQAALQAYEEFERAAHHSEATNVEDPNLGKRGADKALQNVRDIVKGQKAQKVLTGGTIKVKVKVARANGNLVAFNGCYDQSKSVLVRANGTSYTGPLTKKYPRMALTVFVTNASGLWRVSEYDLKADKC
jgi:hypothetical protein